MIPIFRQEKRAWTNYRLLRRNVLWRLESHLPNPADSGKEHFLEADRFDDL
jgi:hypothetical protein